MRRNVTNRVCFTMCCISAEGSQRPIVTTILGQSGPMQNTVETQGLHHFDAQGPRLVHFLRGRPGGSTKPAKSCRDHLIFLLSPQQCNQRIQCFLIRSGDEDRRRISQAPEAGQSGGHGQVSAVRRAATARATFPICCTVGPCPRCGAVVAGKRRVLRPPRKGRPAFGSGGE